MKNFSIFNHKTVILTGAASGIGREMALLLNQCKAKLFLIDLNEKDLTKLASILRKSNPDVHAHCMDVSSHDQFAQFCHEFLKTETCPDYLFNNAGICIGGEALNFDFKSWKKIIDVNLYGVINGISLFYPLMAKQRRGHIVNTSSFAGLIPLPGEASYVASKYAIQGLTEVLEIEASFYGVKVTAVCPGVVQTPIYQTGEVIGFDKEKVLSLWPRGITANKCAEMILEGVAKGKRIILITRFAQFAFLVKRFFPGLMRKGLIAYFKKVKATAT